MSNQSVDKLNMSLDDIIKMNRKNNRQSTFASNRGLNRGAGNNNRKNFPNKNAVSGSGGGGGGNNRGRNNRKRAANPRQQQVSNKPYGMLNKSKAIQKNTGRRENTVLILPGASAQQPPRRRRNNQRNNTPRVSNPAPQRLFNRYGVNPKAARVESIAAHSAPSSTNNIRRKKFVIKQVPSRSEQQKRRAPQPRPQVQQQKRQQQRVTALRSKIVVQTARKNVQKAKRLLATTARKGPIQQIMTQRYANKIGLTGKPNPLRRQRNAAVSKSSSAGRPSGKLARVNLKSTRIVKQQQKVAPRKVQAQAKRPILNRTKPKTQSGSGRMVLY